MEYIAIDIPSTQRSSNRFWPDNLWRLEGSGQCEHHHVFTLNLCPCTVQPSSWWLFQSNHRICQLKAVCHQSVDLWVQDQAHQRQWRFALHLKRKAIHEYVRILLNLMDNIDVVEHVLKKRDASQNRFIWTVLCVKLIYDCTVPTWNINLVFTFHPPKLVILHLASPLSIGFLIFGSERGSLGKTMALSQWLESLAHSVCLCVLVISKTVDSILGSKLYFSCSTSIDCSLDTWEKIWCATLPWE